MVTQNKFQEARKIPLRGGNVLMSPKQKVKKGTFKRLMRYIVKKHRLNFIIAIICIIISSITSALGMMSLKTVIDEYITPLIGQKNADFSQFANFMLIVACIFLVGTVATYIYSRIMAIVSQRVLKDIRDEMFIKMQKLSIKYFDTKSHGETMSYYTNDTDTLRQMISKSLPNLISSLITIISTGIAMFCLSPQLTFLVWGSCLIIITFVKIIAKKGSKFFVAQQQSLGNVNGYVEEMLNGQKVIKVFTHEERIKESFDELNNKLKLDMLNANRFSNSLMPITNNLGNMQYICVAIFGSIWALSTEAPIELLGTLVTFLQLSKSFSQPITQIMNQFSSIITALAGAERIFEFLDIEPEIDNGNVILVNAEKNDGRLIEVQYYTGTWAWKKTLENGEYDYVELKGHIELKNVDFGYTDDKIVLQDISLYAKQGEKVAFVGATGAGKTTITNLINRFYDISNGKIEYDGIDIKQIRKEDLRRSIGMVLQETNLFTGTIKENIRCGKLGATDEDVVAAAKLANAHDFINRLPQGYDTMLTENGAQLSQGQRQLIAIARAAIANPPVMILDEATSSIDTRTEKLVQDGMDKLMKGRTVFVIAHRLSTVRNSKSILVLEKGKIIERGEHDFLINQKGTYYRLYTGAFELE